MRCMTLAVVAFVALGTSEALADFTGQPILGPLSAGSFVTGDTTGRSDSNDGWDSGIHIMDIWDGGDDVWQLNWLGGPMQITLNSLGGSDNDLFLYFPGSYDSASEYSFAGAFDQVTLNNADAGTYYINIDSQFFSEGAYDLRVEAVPAPGAAALLAVGGLVALRRRR